MGFASSYLDKRALFPQFIKEAPDNLTGIIVVIPAYDEPGICRVLDSLSDCDKPGCDVEVLIVVNAPSDASLESVQNNKIAITNIESWKMANNNCFFRLFAINVDNHSFSNWGVGLARKTGMDEAVRRFDSIDNPEGIILNLDADCIVARNYLVSVYEEFRKKGNRSACSIYFEHPLTGNDFDENVYRYITLYELHLRFYYQALLFCGFPYVFHTVGSAIALKALPYIKAGGMNRRQAGEDFYFIQKLVPAGGYFSINSTTVYPSPRVSARVPFGTGASIGKLTDGKMSTLTTYNILAFKELRDFFEMSDLMFHAKDFELSGLFSLFPEGIKKFLALEDWHEKIVEIRNNTSGFESYKKRFFGWFNMFKIVKYLNFVHSDIFEKLPVNISARQLLDATGKQVPQMMIHPHFCNSTGVWRKLPEILKRGDLRFNYPLQITLGLRPIKF